MKNLFTLLSALFLLQTIHAQRFIVEEFRADLSDISAIRHEQSDFNDLKSAIIKVRSNIDGLRFDSNLGITKHEKREGEVWLYFPPERNVRLIAEGFLPQDVSLPEPVQSFVVYIIRLSPKGVPKSVSEDSCGEDITFTYRGRTVTYGTVEGHNGTCWMDRNLGASRVATAYNDNQAYGDLFQRGRGDDGHQLRTSRNHINAQ